MLEHHDVQDLDISLSHILITFLLLVSGAAESELGHVSMLNKFPSFVSKSDYFRA
jgi:hypothetical protein